ncbi:hypothetical protein BGC_19810 [Burkholderia sp. 3C]
MQQSAVLNLLRNYEWEKKMAQAYKALKAQLNELQERTEAARVAELETVVAQIRELVAEYGITEDQIYGRKRGSRAVKQAEVVEPKY